MTDRSAIRRALTDYQWRIGDVFTDGTYRWKVESVEGDRAVLHSCTSFAKTRPLTFEEWHEGGRWQPLPLPPTGGER